MNYKREVRYYVKDEEGRIFYLSKEANETKNKLNEARKIVMQNRKK